MTTLAATLHEQPSSIPHRISGKERDSESGNDYFGARYYASTMGRFLSPDWSAKEEPVPYAKLDNPQTLNLYNYMRNNPLAGVDLDGHCGLDIGCWAAVASTAAGSYLANHPDVAKAAGRVADTMGVKLSLGGGVKGNLGVLKGQASGSGYVSASPRGVGAGGQGDLGASVGGVGGNVHLDVPVVKDSSLLNPLTNSSLTASGSVAAEHGKVGGEVSANGEEVSGGGTYGEGLQVGVEISTGASALKSLANEVVDAAATDVKNVIDTVRNTNGCSNAASCGTAAQQH